jgi:hypothetical protein
MTAHPDSFPFLIAEAPLLVEDDYIHEDHEDDDVEVPSAPPVVVRAKVPPASESSREVPPRPPPAPLRTGEGALPTVIIDLREQEIDAEVEARRASEVDGLLSARLDFPLPLPVRAPSLTAVTVSSPRRSALSFHLRGVAVALVAAITAAGGTLAGFRALHITGSPAPVAATHITP